MASLTIAPARAVPSEQVLYDLTLDIDRDGTSDRAVLVLAGPSPVTFSDAAKEFYILAEGEQADLHVYLGRNKGAGMSQQPDFVKKDLIARDRLMFVMPLKGSNKGSLNVTSSNGFGNTINTTETLTVVYRDSQFLVAGWAQDFYNSRENQSSHCSVNYLAGKAVTRGNNGKDIPVKGVFKPLLLAEWSSATQPRICEV